MSLCISSSCSRPDHPGNDDSRFCQSCGSELLLQGRYRVMRLISDSSGFGKVYEAYERTTPKILKVLKSTHNINRKVVELFQQEALVLSQLKHPGVPKVESDGYFQFMPRDGSEPLHCIVMEEIDGPNLTQWMQQQGNHPISEKQALNWLKQLVEILHLVHQKNYFHRDIKPQNIMIRSTGQLVLVDFGAAREMSDTYLAQIGGSGSLTKISSAGYTPPEQEKGHAIPQSDFYALGRTFIYLLTGKQLTDDGIYDALKDEYNWRAHALVSLQFADLIDKLTSPRAVNRPKNTQEILNTLSHISGSQTSSQTSGSETSSHPISGDVSQQNSTSNPEGYSPQLLPNLLSAPSTVVKSAPELKRKWLVGGAIALLVGLGGYGIWQVYHRYPSVGITSNQASVLRTLAGHTSYVNALAISPDGSTLVSGSADRTIKIWNFATAAEILTLAGHTSYVNALVISPDGSTLVSGSADRTIKIWDLLTGAELRELNGHTSYVNALAISPDGSTLVSGSADRTIKIWDLLTGTELRTLTGHTSYINALVITPNGERLISGSADNTIKVWNLATGEEIQTLRGHAGSVNALAVTPDGGTLITGSADNTIKVWNLVTGEEIQTLTGHANYVNAIAISPDGKTLVSGSADKTFKFWDLSTGNEATTLVGYGQHIDFFAIHPSWQAIATGSGDQVIEILQVP